MRIIFLDIDGVLNSDAHWKEAEEIKDDSKYLVDREISVELLKRLKRVYTSFDDVKIVLSSSWKNLRPTNSRKVELFQLFEKYEMEVIDETPSHSSFGEYLTERPQEIEEWLLKHPSVTKWCSIEDDWNVEDYLKISEEFATHLVRTEFYCNTLDEGGLTENAVKKAIKILS